MSISSLVIDVAPDAVGRAAIAALTADARITLGPSNGTRHTLVLDTSSIAADADGYAWIERLPGVRLVTLVRAYFDDEAPADGAAYL